MMIFLTVILFLSILYYACTVFLMVEDSEEFDSKKDFWLSFVPFYRWVKKIINNYKDLKN